LSVESIRLASVDRSRVTSRSAVPACMAIISLPRRCNPPPLGLHVPSLCRRPQTINIVERSAGKRARRGG
jgi:hypothetical protein